MQTLSSPHHRFLRYLTEPLVWLLASFMIGLALLSFVLTWNDEQEQLTTSLQADASEMTRVIEVHLAANEQSLLAVRALFAVTPQVDRATFRQFVTPLLVRSPSTQAITWVAYVPAAARPAFEQARRLEDLPDVGLFEQDANGANVPAGTRADYFPVTFVEPFTANQAALGFDSGSVPAERQALLRARDTGQSTLTPPLQLVPTTNGERHLLLFTPVYRQGVPTNTLAARQANLLGFLASRLQMSSLVATALRDISAHDLELYLFDVSDVPPQLLAFQPSRSGAATLPVGPAPPELASLEVGVFYTTQLERYGRMWRVVARPGPAYLAEAHGWDAWIHMSIGLLAAVGFLGYSYTRRRAEVRLRQSEAHYRLVSENAADVIWILDLDSQNFTYVSPSVQKLRGYTPEEVRQQTMAQTLTPASLSKVLLLLVERPPAVGLPPRTDELDQICKDGSIVTTEVTTNYVLKEAGKFQVVGVSRDITLRKQADVRLKQLNRTYALLSAINQTIVRIREPEQLFETTCRIAVTQGGFRMAWIGLLDPQTNMVQPAAHAGESDDYLPHLHIVLDDSAWGHGPTATALRTGKHVVVNDIANDPRMAPWRTDALRLGYHASAAFPLIVSGRLYGALNLYASEPAFFDADELNLLDEMVADLVFALAFSEQEAQRQRAEVQIRQLSHVVEQMDDMVVITDVQGNIEYVNPSFERQVGYTSAEVRGQNPRILKSGLERPTIYVRLWATILRGESYQSEVRNRKKNGDLYYEAKTITPIRNKDGVITHFVSTGRDITAQKQAEAALRASEARYRVIFEGTNEGIVAMRMADQSLQYINPAMCTLFGYTPDEFRQFTVRDLHPQEALSHVLAEFEALARGEKQLVAGIRCQCKNGSIFYADFKATAALLEGQAFLVGFFSDVTERYHAEEALIAERNSLARRVEERTADLSRANSELLRAVRAKDEFLATMSHELRTPLNAILALSESLLEQFRGPLNERQQAALHNIEASGHHLLALINDILDLSKVESGRMELQCDIFMISEVCEASLLFVKELALKKQLQLAFPQHNPLARMHADSRRLKQILVNLLSNAVKFTNKGGRVSLAVNADPEAGVIRFVVEDTGIGMDAAGMARLFQPFVQLDSRLSRQHEGTGLGLALVHRLTELHGGGVTVASELGKGSCFTVALPYTPPAPLETLRRSATASLPMHSAVVIEDVDTAGEQLVRYLQELHIHAVVHPQGEGALEQVANLRPDVILLDLQMPGQSGWDVLRQLKADPQLHAIPVIIVSVVDERTKGLAAGAAEYLVKPTSREAIRRALGVVGAGPETAHEAMIIAVPLTPPPVNERILLVEDNEININAISDYLQDRGYHVVVARNGREALARVDEARPDVILMDIQMPEMDGLEATRQLRAQPTYAALPIIVLTALAMPGDRERCMAAGASEYLTKPVSLKGLVATIQHMLKA